MHRNIGARISFRTLARMRNIQVIDGAINAVYDIFCAADEAFDLIFPSGQDVAFINSARSPWASYDCGLGLKQEPQSMDG